MAGKLIPMRELRALAKRAYLHLREDAWVMDGEGRAKIWLTHLWGYRGRSPVCIGDRVECRGRSRTKRAAQIQARENVKLFLDAVLAMRYGEGE